MTQVVQQAPFPRTSDSAGATPPSGSSRARVLVVAFLALLLGGGFTVARRFAERKSLVEETEKLAIPTVAVLKPAAEPASDDLVLPAQLQAYVESAIYARTNGYLLRWYKDIGSHVKKGDLLAEIDTPEVDQELAQARATSRQTAAQLELAQSTAERWVNLRKTDSVSQQEADQQTNGYKQSQANLAAADANVHRLEQLESFKRIYAPFTGVITQRSVDVGALINAGNSGQAKGLFNIAQVDTLRVYISVPQMESPFIRSGVSAWIALNEFPGKKFEGKVVRTSDSIDPGTRTLLTEIDVPNRSGELLPGSYGQVHLAVPVTTVRISIPVNALLFRPEGPRVAVVGSDQKAHLKPITIGRDFGTKVEILGGLTSSDDVVVNPADSLEDGQQVHVKPSEGPRPAR